MKDFIENLLQKYGDNRALPLFVLFFYLTFCFIIGSICNGVPIWDNFSKVLINPVVFFGVPALFLKHARYKELLKIYKNYTTEEFLAVYQQPYNIAYENDVKCNPDSMASINRRVIYYYNELTLEKFRPLARDLLCIGANNPDVWILKDWIKEGKSLEDFIKTEYKKSFNIKNSNSSFWWIVFLGIYIQLSLWGIVEYDEE